MNTNQFKWRWQQWVVILLVSFIFLMAGITKFTGNPDQWAVFQKAGYSITFYHWVAVLEIAGAIGLWVKRARIITTIALIALMSGALVTQIWNHDYLHCFGPVLFGLLLTYLLRKWMATGGIVKTNRL